MRQEVKERMVEEVIRQEEKKRMRKEKKEKMREEANVRRGNGKRCEKKRKKE